ncbi:MAG: hypothetical protein D6690_09475 [Nitrospirae bacterium]|nr:MAG: hypothetical protein D6690_09475 [Nitrospirota bacterium]
MRLLQILALVLVVTPGLVSCSGKFVGGTAVGVLGAGAGYEYKAKKEMDRIQEELEAGRMSKEEYEIRKDQIERMSVIQ